MRSPFTRKPARVLPLPVAPTPTGLPAIRSVLCQIPARLPPNLQAFLSSPILSPLRVRELFQQACTTTLTDDEIWNLVSEIWELGLQLRNAAVTDVGIPQIPTDEPQAVG